MISVCRLIRDVLVLLGPNGAGKTSAVEAISGLLPKRRGKVEFFGADISGLSASAIVRGSPSCRNGVSYFPRSQWRKLIAAATAAEHREPKSLKSIYKLFPVLEERRQQLAGSLSGGEQQMLAIGRALVTNPKLLLLDEPSAGLASGVARTLIQTINQSG